MAETYQLKNDQITVEVSAFGAELQSLKDCISQEEYLWNGDETYWMRRSPILFPFVGGLKEKKYRYKGITYSMSQHGFARDKEFTLKSQKTDEIWFELQSSEETKAVYPFDFILRIGYRIKERTLAVLWEVVNPGQETLHFSIGAHPGFMCPRNGQGSQSEYYLEFDEPKELLCTPIDQNGLVQKEKYAISLNEGKIQISEHLFDKDALVIEHHQAHTVSLLTKEQKPYVTVRFDAPLFGVWSPPGKKAPFVCIEPWYGRCDTADFTGELEERDWTNALDAQQSFAASYTIEI